MNKEILLEKIVKKIFSLQKEKAIIVAINGIDGAGKSFFAKELVDVLKTKSNDIILASVDGFHNPRKIRYQKGKDSAEGFYKDSYNYDKLLKLLINPIRNNETICKNAYFDCEKDKEIFTNPINISNKTILVLEGIFLFRPELINLWDYKIFLSVSFETSLERDIKRSSKPIKQLVESHKKRYKAGQILYLEEAKPKLYADIVIDNNDFNKPKFI